MRTHLYSRLALDGIRKNRRLYIPYMLTGSLMVMMYYILSFLSVSPALSRMKGGATLSLLLPLGSGVIAVFSLIFLFYTNSFLVRQRNKEFGLYNILGMDKRNIRKIMLWENGMIAAASILSGLGIGAVLSKLAEVGLLNILELGVDYQLSIDVGSLSKTAVLYVGIYFCLLVNSILRVQCLNPLELLQSSRVGEKPPKVNWLPALIGIVLLGFAYYLAVSIEAPLTALIWFFFAVIMVIIATYLLFGAGSVVFCRMLQKNKKYYYKANHFVSVSSMVYRMKRNGAGLASICILSTMVLVMISSTASLYIGAEDSLRERYPYSMELRIGFDDMEEYTEENFAVLRALCEEIPTKYGEREYRSASTSGLLQNGNLITSNQYQVNFEFDTYDSLCEVLFCSLEDYNQFEGKAETLNVGECLIYSDGIECRFEQFTIDGELPLKVKKVLDDFLLTDSAALASVVPCVYIVVDNLEEYAAPLLSRVNDSGYPVGSLCWQYAFQTELSTDENVDIMQELKEELRKFSMEEEVFGSYSIECQDALRSEFFEMYGGLFFLGIMLSVVFLFAAVLIIYYKQISEGYEDQARFEIMQKVGMTKREIKRSVNSQILTVFFLPLVFAGIHLAFAFPIVFRLLQLFFMRNLGLMILVTVGCFLVFGVFYAIVYKLTAGAYYTIVSGSGEK
ncbi:MAG: ABC transporter permease [Lachnospiraceae bacterium]|nr:ABC transporter permease [Lachnospiraceae bacterium]